MPEAEDSQLEIKKRARRRLVGAIALSLFAAIVFPLVMDPEPGPLVQDIEIRIPGQDDRGMNQRLAPAPPDSAAAQDAAPANPPVPNETAAPTAGTGATPTPTQPAVAPTPSTTPAAQAVAAVPVKRVDAKPATENKPAANKASDKSSATKTVVAEKKPSKPEEKNNVSETGQFMIQIGAFSNEGNIKNLRAKLSEIGVKSFTEPLGDKTRVRAGPFPSREAAEKALSKMKAIGISGPIASK